MCTSHTKHTYEYIHTLWISGAIDETTRNCRLTSFHFFSQIKQRGGVILSFFQAQLFPGPPVQRPRGYQLHQLFHQEQNRLGEGNDGLFVCAVRAARHGLRHGGAGEAGAEVQGGAAGGEGPAVRAPAVHAPRHVRGRLHLRTRPAAQVLHRRNLRHGFEAAHPENSRRPHNVPTTTQVHRGALAGSRGGRTQRVIRKHTLRVIV